MTPMRPCIVAVALLALTALAGPSGTVPVRSDLRLVGHGGGSGMVQIIFGRETLRLTNGATAGRWTLMGECRAPDGERLAILEDFTDLKGHMLFVGASGVVKDFSKTAEATSVPTNSLYRGHRLEEIFASPRDLLGDEILAKPGDPGYSEIAACFPPIARMHVYSFLGTRESFEKVGVFYGGSFPSFDPVAYVPEVKRIREEGGVLDGLVGGWLPVLRFVYPEREGDWTELIAFAPMRRENANPRVQPVWYRICRVKNNQLAWARYFDSYHGFPPRTDQRASACYTDLLRMENGWERAIAPAMRVAIPDQRIIDMAKHSLVREMMTRIGSFPKYGVFDRGYGGSEHDGFQDTFTADTTAMLEWGLFDLAREYIDNYLTFFVRDDGSVLYRGPETGQFGRMLTVLAQYAERAGDHRLLLKHRKRIDAITMLLLEMRRKALALPPNSAAFGMIAGWSEADSCLDPEPERYMQPYFSNSTEAARGFRDLGRVWERLGANRASSELARRGEKLREEADRLDADVQTAIQRSMITSCSPAFLPAIAGVASPFHVAVAKDGLDPQFRSYRAYAEMMYSGSLSKEQVREIVDYRAANHDVILGIPIAYGYNAKEWAGFLSYGHAYGLLQRDFIREFLLTFHSLLAHHYSRGVWTAPETRRLNPKEFAAPYCTPAQLVAPLLLRWMLVFEDPNPEALWLAKGTPREWLRDGQSISVSQAPTRWGSVGFEIRSRLAERRIDARLDLPRKGISVPVVLRLRVQEGAALKSVLVQGKNWDGFDPVAETVTLKPGARGVVTIEARY